MRFKAKLRKIGNSQGIYIPKNVITNYKIGDVITLEVITSKKNVITKERNVITEKRNVITPKKNVITLKKNVITKLAEIKKDVITKDTRPNWEFCPKHKGFKSSCGCK